MLIAKKFLKQKKIWENCIPGEVFSLYFLLQDFPPTMMPFWLIPQKGKKIRKMQVIWDLGRGNPATLERKNRTCHVTPPPPSSDLALGAEGGRERALDITTNIPNLNVSFKFSKKVNIFIYLIANLAGNRNNIETYRDIETVSRALQQLRWGGGEKGYAVSRPGHMWPELPGSLQPEAVRRRG